MPHVLDNVLWETLRGRQAAFSTGARTIKRYAPGLPSAIGCENPDEPDFKAIEPYCQPGERFYLSRWSGPPPVGWQIDLETSADIMVWAGGSPESDSTAIPVKLTREHLPKIHPLIEATHPGPFTERTLELGDFFGIIEGGELLAMAGERMHAGGYREISTVCTAPTARGRGLARILMNTVISAQLARGETPFLHVLTDNTNAHRIYQRMGFVSFREVLVRVVAYTG
jgi:ribosomal protein S18 acetylase RimI-like enzyme